MVNKKDLIIVALATFCLTATLFLTIPSHGNLNNYDPWADVNCDGNVDIYDAILLANAFNTQGTPIDKSQYAIAGTLTKPAFDSGWTYIAQDAEQIFTHNLSTTNVFVYMIGKTNESASPYIHQIDYGGELNYGSQYGVQWYDLTETTIRVHRRRDDTNWDQVRIYMWKIPEP
jgi:hypothetical protein